MQALIFDISSSPRSKIEVIEFLEVIQKLPDVLIENDKTECVSSRSIEGLIVLLLSSSALAVFAQALRDFVKKKEVHIQIDNENGQKISIDAKGDDLCDVANIVGYLTSRHKKETTESIKEISVDNPLKINIKLNDIE